MYLLTVLLEHHFEVRFISKYLHSSKQAVILTQVNSDLYRYYPLLSKLRPLLYHTTAGIKRIPIGTTCVMHHCKKICCFRQLKCTTHTCSGIIQHYPAFEPMKILLMVRFIIIYLVNYLDR